MRQKLYGKERYNAGTTGKLRAVRCSRQTTLQIDFGDNQVEVGCIFGYLGATNVINMEGSLHDPYAPILLTPPNCIYHRCD